MNSPASGLRLVVERRVGGSIRPGLNVSRAPRPVSTTSVELVDVPPGRSTNASPRSVRNRKPADVAAGRPAVLIVDRIDLPVLVGWPAGRAIAAISVFQVTSAAVDRLAVPPVTPSLSWISSIETMSGALRLLISVSASPAYLPAGRPARGSRR